jgi:hypothetical protein
MRSYLDSRCLFGFVIIGAAAGCVEVHLGTTSQAEAGSVCAFVTAQIGGQTITTPSIAVIVPDNGITTDPIRVHIDQTTQNILGYSLRTPGVDQEIAGQNLFVPGRTLGIPSFSRTLPLLGLAVQHCAAAGVTTPAVPIHIPASVLQIPGAAFDVPAITVTHLGQQTTVPGRTLFLEGRQIVLPGADATVQPITVQSPESTIRVVFDATQQPPSPLPDAIILEPRM